MVGQTSLAAQQFARVDGNQLVDELTVRDVHFLLGGTRTPASHLSSAALLGALASSAEARLRLAIIPLLLRQPAYAVDVGPVVATLGCPAQLVLQCYYTAALLLQEKYQRELRSLCGEQTRLLDLFSKTLGVPILGEVDERLRVLAAQHQVLSGSYINWYGTYEHAAKNFVAILRHLRACQA
jgi:hypothetical protein